MLEGIGTDALFGVVIDAVGTLIEPDPPVSLAYREAAIRQGIDLAPEEVRARFGRAFREAEAGDLRGRLATDEAGEVRRWRRIVAVALPELPDPERGFLELWDHFGRAESWRLFDDALPTLQALERAGLPVRIGSNFDGRLRPIVRGLQGMSPYLDSLVISSEVGWRKPHPGFYEAACRSLGLEPCRVLFVGDDAENDFLGPRRCGIPSLLLDRRNRPGGSGDRIGTLADLVVRIAPRTA